ncbi:PAS domain-containing sensor histidine kinase [Brevundimonas sp.]|uniref:hybrid sensor histidine kinase/response regulator n=1 Tax=Brevundimonas sp. TaxID=1871086 RepID=UPI0025FAE53B|nr:PAS domain-containing sensor histidine kinase [Brevundimonas sp.]
MNASLQPRISTDEDRYRLLVDAITDYAIYMLDPGGLVTSWNPGARRFKGYVAEEIIGQHFSRFYTPEDRQAGVPERALRTAAEEGRWESEGWRVRKDGERFWAHVVVDAIRSPDGQLLGFAKITRDLTERRAAAEALKRSEEQFRLLVQGVTDYAIYMLDPEGKVSSWNEGARRIKGYEPEEIVGEHFSRFYAAEDRAAGWPEKALQAAAEQGRFEREGWRVRKDGSRFWAHVILDAIHDDDGQVIGYAKITRDITERMEAQRQLDEAREALFQSQKMEAVGQLTGGVAHDFNNLLMAVLGSLELVKKRVPYDPKVSPLIENAIQGARRGAVLTQRLLSFARKQELALEPVDIASLVRGMTEFLSRSIGLNIEVVTRFPAGLPVVRTDPNQLETALLNLAVNARDAMPEGGTITISAAREVVAENAAGLSPGLYVRLTVSDTGAGMDAHTLARASEPFFTTKGVGKGTGLGLSMVHGLAAQSGGRLDIESRPGHGTTVHLLLPVAEGVEVSKGEDGRAPAGQPREGRLLILAVDDDDLVLMNTVAMLEDLGHEVLSASSGVEALTIVEERPWIDLVLTDQIMPHMTGLEFAEAVSSTRPNLPVAVVTGFADLPEGEALGLARLPKPFTQAELGAFINTAARRRAEA